MIKDAPSPVWIAVGGLLALAASLGIGRFVFTPILPLMMDDIGMTKAVAGLMASVNYAGYLLGALAASAPLGFGSRRWCMVGALAASAATTGAMGFASATPACLAVRFLGGVASAFVMVFASALVLDRLAAAGRPELLAVHFSGVGCGIAVSAVVVSVLVAAGCGWRLLWYACGLLSLVCLAAVCLAIPSRTEPLSPPPREATGHDAGLSRLVIAYGLFGFGYVITSTFLVTIVRASRQTSDLEPVIWLLVGITAAPSVTLWGSLSRRMGTTRALSLAFALEAAGVAASVVWTARPGLVAAAVLLGGTFMGITALGLVEARHRSQIEPRRTVAIMITAFGLGQMLGPALAGVVHDVTGSFFAPSLGAAAALLVGAALVLAPSRVPA